VATPARADHPPAPDPSLPRQLTLSERRLPAADSPPGAAQALQFALAAALHPVAERMSKVTNPYACGCPSAIGEDLPAGSRCFPEHAPDPVLEDPNDLMGVSLGRGAILGLHVDMLGPVELPETYKRLTNPRRDPTDMRYTLTSLGLRLGF
jgi:hypothetical protein